MWTEESLQLHPRLRASARQVVIYAPIHWDMQSTHKSIDPGGFEPPTYRLSADRSSAELRVKSDGLALRAKQGAT